MKTENSKISIALLILLALIIPIITQKYYYMHTFIVAFQSVVLVATYRLVLRSGQFSFGHHFFAMVGGYTSALLTIHFGISFWIAFPLAGLMGAFFAVVTGYPFLRIRGIYFAVITWAIGTVAQIIVTRLRFPFGGANGLMGVPRPSLPFIGPIHNIVFFYYLALAIVIFVVVALYYYEYSRLGLTMNAIREADELAYSLGINIMRSKVQSYTVAGFFGALIGSFYVHYMTMITPNDFTVFQTLEYLVYLQIGGQVSFWGPLVGSLCMTFISQALMGAGFWRIILLGLLLIIFTLWLPEGLVGLPKSVTALYRRFFMGKLESENA